MVVAVVACAALDGGGPLTGDASPGTICPKKAVAPCQAGADGVTTSMLEEGHGGVCWYLLSTSSMPAPAQGTLSGFLI